MRRSVGAMNAMSLEGLSLFRRLSADERRRVAPWTDEVSVAAGRELAAEGNFAHEFFVIAEGSAAVLQDGEHVGDLGPGEFFGELGLLATERRTATVVSTTPMKLVVMFQREFKQMEHEMPAAGNRIRAAMRARLDS
jgi:CRP-like cAMP-binding protein